jgi:hypothetical protein
MQDKKQELKNQIDLLYVELEAANKILAHSHTSENEAQVKLIDDAIDKLVDQLIEIDDDRL